MGAALFACCTVVDLSAEKHDASASVPLLADYEEMQEKYDAPKRRGKTQAETQALTEKLSLLVAELFCLQDLNSDGVLGEDELVKLNEKIAMLHYGTDIDRVAVRTKYRSLFREQLDANGRPVPLAVFRRYVFKVLKELDPDLEAQEMILEQFIAEAQSARDIFRCDSFYSTTDDCITINSPRRRQDKFRTPESRL